MWTNLVKDLYWIGPIYVCMMWKLYSPTLIQINKETYRILALAQDQSTLEVEQAQYKAQERAKYLTQDW